MVDRQLAENEPLDEGGAASHVAVRSDRDPGEIVDDIEAHLDRRLASPVRSPPAAG